MGKINQHIEKLLAYHDYVVVPGLGGFVVQHQSAVIHDDRITAPAATVGFNPLMHHADGLLAIEVARANGITYRKAMEIIDFEVNEIKKQLHLSKNLLFGNIGILTQNENGTIGFTPSSSAEFLPFNLGLTDIYVSKLEMRLEKSRKISFALPTARAFKYAAAAVLLVGMLMISPQVNDFRHINTADFISFSLNKPIIGKPAKEAILTPKVLEDIAVKEIQNDSNLFHVVVASLPTQISAERYCESLRNEDFTSAHVIKPTKLYRIALKSFTDKSEAIAFMENLRKTDVRFETAWVLCK